MSNKTRVFAALVTAWMIAGTASFALAEPRQSRRSAVVEGESGVEQLFEWVRELFVGRRDANERTTPTAPNSWQKDGSHLDPNGCTVNCPK